MLVLASSFVGLLSPWPFAFLIDTVLTKENPLPGWLTRLLGSFANDPVNLIFFAVFAGLAITALERGLSVFDSYVNTKLELRVALDFRSELYQHVMKLSLAHHDQKQSGMMVYAVNYQADAVARLIMIVPGLAQSVFALIGTIWIVLALDWELGLLSLIVVPFLYFSVGFYARHIQERLYNVKGLEGQCLAIIHEALSMIRVIVAFGREAHEYRRFRNQSEIAIKARVRITIWQTLFSLVVDTITALGTALILGIGAYHVLQGKLTVGQLTVILAYIAAIYRPLEAISTTVGSLQDIFTSMRFALDLLDTKPDIRDASDAKSIGRSAGHICYEDVGFTYEGRQETLKDINFEAKPGKVVAIVGPTGAGKTTLISLLPRFYEAASGRVTLDGTDIRKFTLASLRAQVSIVLQEPLLFSGSIRENIRYGNLQAADHAIVQAAIAANAHDFITRLPMGYDTELGERGAKLSGGERQRIAVARAFLKDAPILILDEPTSSIDSKTEAVILDALDRLMQGRTTFMIAHRLSTIRRADTILVLDGGHLVEQGTHVELLEKNGLYKQLHELQTKARTRGVTEEVIDEESP